MSFPASGDTRDSRMPSSAFYSIAFALVAMLLERFEYFGLRNLVSMRMLPARNFEAYRNATDLALLASMGALVAAMAVTLVVRARWLAVVGAAVALLGHLTFALGMNDFVVLSLTSVGGAVARFALLATMIELVPETKERAPAQALTITTLAFVAVQIGSFVSSAVFLFFRQHFGTQVAGAFGVASTCILVILAAGAAGFATKPESSTEASSASALNPGNLLDHPYRQAPAPRLRDPLLVLVAFAVLLVVTGIGDFAQFAPPPLPHDLPTAKMSSYYGITGVIAVLSGCALAVGCLLVPSLSKTALTRVWSCGLVTAGVCGILAGIPLEHTDAITGLHTVFSAGEPLVFAASFALGTLIVPRKYAPLAVGLVSLTSSAASRLSWWIETVWPPLFVFAGVLAIALGCVLLVLARPLSRLWER